MLPNSLKLILPLWLLLWARMVNAAAPVITGVTLAGGNPAINIQSDIIHTIERPDGTERVVFHRYMKEYSPNQGFWAIQERRDGDLWCRVMWWDVGHPESFDKALEKARLHVPWLGSALLSSLLARGAEQHRIGK